jgi:hypothetical protein
MFFELEEFILFFSELYNLFSSFFKEIKRNKLQSCEADILDKD